MITDKYNDETAVKLRKRLQQYTEQINELKYRLFSLAKEAVEVEKDYANYLGYTTISDVQGEKKDV